MGEQKQGGEFEFHEPELETPTMAELPSQMRKKGRKLKRGEERGSRCDPDNIKLWVAGVALAVQRLSMRISSKLIDRAEVWTQTPTQEPTLQGTGSFPPPLMMTQAQIVATRTMPECPPSTSPSSLSTLCGRSAAAILGTRRSSSTLRCLAPATSTTACRSQCRHKMFFSWQILTPGLTISSSSLTRRERGSGSQETSWSHWA